MVKNKKKTTETKSNDVDSNEELNEELLSDKENFNETQDKEILDTIRFLEEKVLRAQAEADNIRRSSQKEILKARTYSAELLIKDLLSPIDNLIRSLEHSEKEIPRNLIELVTKEISQALINNNIQEINPHGEKFDPNFHEALSINKDNTKESEEILEVIQKGYKIQDRIIRPALVIVNKI